ncbi:MAG: ATP-binding protein [Chitinophagaceae bacterium]
MDLIKRQILGEANLLASQFRAISIIGPRQSGKTTLSKWVFGEKPYVNFELPSIQNEAEADMGAFLKKYSKGAILDEVQRVPDIFRHLQVMLDNNKSRGQFILTGSNNFLLQEHLSQSLAGRIGYLQLLPLSYGELLGAGLATDNIYKQMLSGGYPEIWDQKLLPDKWMSAYVQTYVERDVRLLRNISNLGSFVRFLMICANYAGQLINRDEMARNIGVDTKTIQAWLGILESSFIIFLLQPWYGNLNKRIIKSPKLYFYDTGLLCHLLGISTQSALQKHPLYGSIFENWIITEIKKNRYNEGINERFYFFRDSAGNEVDVIMEKQGLPVAVEIKAGKKIQPAMLGGLRYWLKNNPGPSNHGILIYGGKSPVSFSEQMQAISWETVSDV